MLRNLLSAAAIAIASIPATAAEFAFSFAVGQVATAPVFDLSQPPAQPPFVVYTKSLSRHEARGQSMSEEKFVRVPVYHASNWARYCHRYDACGHPVRFVPDGRYQVVYVTRNEKGRYTTVN